MAFGIFDFFVFLVKMKGKKNINFFQILIKSRWSFLNYSTIYNNSPCILY